MYVCKKKHTSRSWVLVAPLEKKIQLMLQKKPEGQIPIRALYWIPLVMIRVKSVVYNHKFIFLYWFFF